MNESLLYMGKTNKRNVAAAYWMLLIARKVRKTKCNVEILQKVLDLLQITNLMHNSFTL
jgi:hypothetical protein